MIITRIFNNNVIEANNNGRDVILQGKGIGFGKKVGDEVVDENVSKIFELTDKKYYLLVQDILNTIPEEYWKFCNEVQTYIETELEIKLNTNFYLSLLDHIYTAVIRTKDGIHLSSLLGQNIELYYPKIYEVSSNVVKMMESNYEVKFDSSEVYFIFIHIIDAVTNKKSIFETKETLLIMQDIESKINSCFDNAINKDSKDYARFLRHLEQFTNKIMCNNINIEKNEQSSTIYSSLSKEYDKQSKCVDEVVRFINNKYQCNVGLDEKFYLLLHIIKITN